MDIAAALNEMLHRYRKPELVTFQQVAELLAILQSPPSPTSGVNSVVAGPGIDVDATDPQNPVVSSKITSFTVADTGWTGNNAPAQASLVGLTADSEFLVFTGGTLLTLTDDYTFNSGTGVITVPTGAVELRIVKLF